MSTSLGGITLLVLLLVVLVVGCGILLWRVEKRDAK